MRRATLVAALGLLLVMSVGVMAEAAGPVFSASGSGNAGDILTVTATVEGAASSAIISASFTVDFGSGPGEPVNLIPISGGDSGGAYPASPLRETTRHPDKRHEHRDRRWHRWRHHHPRPQPQPDPTVTWIATGYVPVPVGTQDGDYPVVVTFIYNGATHVVQAAGHVGG